MKNLNKSIRKNLRISYFLFWAMVRNTSESTAKIGLDIFIMAIRLLVLLSIYKVLFDYVGNTVRGEIYQTVAWSMFFYFAFMNINPRYISRLIQQDIKSGKIQDLLIKPFSYILYRLSSYLGGRSYQTLINVFLFTPLMVFFVGPVPNMFTGNFYISIFFTVVFGFILSFFIFMSLGLLSFWIEDITPIQWIVDKFVMVLGGSYLPVAFFPSFMKTLAVWSPFGATQFITHTPYTSWPAEYLKLLGIQFMWIIVFSFILYFMFNSALKKVVTNGG